MTAPRPPVLLEPAAVRVARGAVFLDHADAPWFEAMDDETLCVYDDTLCPLGQRYGSYGRGIQRLGVVDPVALGFHPVRVAALGGTATEEEALEDAGDLTREWCRLIRQRRIDAAAARKWGGGR